VCAGRSIPDLYDFLKDEGRHQESAAVRAELATADDRTPPIVAAALNEHEHDPLCLAAIEMFVANLGAEAGNLALSVFATGGVYLAGGMAQRVLPALGAELFLSRFQDKGRLSPLLAQMPVKLILGSVGLFGAAASSVYDATSSGGTVIA
jgi:glucokinase